DVSVPLGAGVQRERLGAGEWLKIRHRRAVAHSERLSRGEWHPLRHHHAELGAVAFDVPGHGDTRGLTQVEAGIKRIDPDAGRGLVQGHSSVAREHPRRYRLGLVGRRHPQLTFVATPDDAEIALPCRLLMLVEDGGLLGLLWLQDGFGPAVALL